MPRPEKSAGAELERLDEQLMNVHVQLTKLDVLVDIAARNTDAARHPRLVETIRYHRDGMVESSRVIAQRIDAIGRLDAGRQASPPRDIHKNCG
jgi:hypothetical protein